MHRFRDSPRADTGLMLFLCQEGLRVASYVEFSVESKNQNLTKFVRSVFVQFALESVNLLTKCGHFFDMSTYNEVTLRHTGMFPSWTIVLLLHCH